MWWNAHRARVFPAQCRLHKNHPAGAPMNRLPPRPLKVERDFTDARLTGFGGWSAPALTAERLNLFGDLSEGVSVKARRRGASAGESLWALAGLLGAAHRPALSAAPRTRQPRLVTGLDERPTTDILWPRNVREGPPPITL